MIDGRRAVKALKLLYSDCIVTLERKITKWNSNTSLLMEIV
jgi:hypothetical protein